MSKIMYIIAGPNGSGKTTLAKEIVREEDITFLNADEIAKNLNDKIGIRSGKILLSQMDELFRDGGSFVLESTISGLYHLRAIERAKQEHYDIVFIYVFLESAKQNIARIKMRVKLGGHNVPTVDVKRRYNRSLNNFWKTIPNVKYWELYYNGGERFELVARSDSKRLEIVNEQAYNKFKGIKND